MLLKGFGKRLRELFQSREFDDQFFLDLEDAMIEADMGVRVATETADGLRQTVKSQGIRGRAELVAALKSSLRGTLLARGSPW